MVVIQILFWVMIHVWVSHKNKNFSRVVVEFVFFVVGDVYIFLFLAVSVAPQDEKNQLMTTNVWLWEVSLSRPLWAFGANGCFISVLSECYLCVCVSEEK